MRGGAGLFRAGICAFVSDELVDDQMGIKGLLPALKDITEKKHARDFRGKVGCVDTYSW